MGNLMQREMIYRFEIFLFFVMEKLLLARIERCNPNELKIKKNKSLRRFLSAGFWG